MTKMWNNKELAIALEWALSDAQVAAATGRSHTSVQRKRERLRADKRVVIASSAPFAGYGGLDPAPPMKQATTTMEEDASESDNDYWERNYKALKKKYKTVLEEKCLIDRLTEDIKVLAPVSYDPRPPAIPDRNVEHEPQSACLMLSDSHVGQKVDSDQTLGFGGYDMSVFLARLAKLQHAVVSIVTEHITTRVPELVIWWGGDMLHGNLGHAAEADHVVTLFDQYYEGAHAFAKFIRDVAHVFPLVRCYAVVGNHTRWGTQHKMPTTNRFSNLDMFLYTLAEALTKDIKNVLWYLDAQPMCRFEIQKHSFLGLHGDTLRGGDKALGIPAHAVGRMLNCITQLTQKGGEFSPNYYLVGHLHRSMTLPHGRGAVMVNGGFSGLDGYGLSEFFQPVDPVQRFFFVNSKYGVTAHYELALK